MNYYVYVPYSPLMHTYHPTDHKCKNSYPVDMYYTHPTYFDYRFYAVPTYHETEYQMGRRKVRKEKGGPDFEAPSYRNSDLGISSPHDPDFETPSYRDSDLGTSSPHDSFLDNLYKDGPYGDITVAYPFKNDITNGTK
ncbi:hypothetical protein [Priestia megaterium]|uniref:hypothetical protein n=1 Tax=Priestia megaterium TaxID=1404 RepID=UPI000BFB1F78|nr:hypothetical protein [Priestia megaterium]PGT76610.1 hypothetical protein COD15_03175 [Priestia megaterium]